MKRTTTLAVLLGVVLAVVVVPAPANAATPSGYVRPPAPSTAAVWGVPYAELPTCSSPGALDVSAKGGWSPTPTLYSVGFNGPAESLPRPLEVRLLEPCTDIGAGNGGQRIRLGYMGYQIPQSASQQGAQIAHGTAATDNSTSQWAECQTFEWSTTGTRWRYYPTSGTNAIRIDSSRVGQDSHFLGLQPLFGAASVPSGNSQCNYLVSITNVVCGYSPNGVRDCKTFRWVASDWYAGKSYSFNENPQAGICDRIDNANAQCVYLNVPDELTFETVCAYAPVFDWGVWDWLKDAVIHYARCMFVPPDTFDRNGTLSTALEGSVVAEIASAVSAATDSFVWDAGGCGELFAVNAGPLSGFNVNTCTWTWAGTARSYLAVMVALFGGLFVMRFVASTLLGLANRKTISPVPDGDGTK